MAITVSFIPWDRCLTLSQATIFVLEIIYIGASPTKPMNPRHSPSIYLTITIWKSDFPPPPPQYINLISMNLNGVIGLSIFLGSILLCITASILVGFLRKRSATPGGTDDGGQPGNISILTSSSSETSSTDVSAHSHEDHDTPNTTLSTTTTASAEGWDPANATPTAIPNNNFAQSQQIEEHSAQAPGSHHPTLHRISREPSPAQAVSHVEAGPSNSQPLPLARSVTQQLRSGSGEINRASGDNGRNLSRLHRVWSYPRNLADRWGLM